ncbi:MFS general substrate transporter [Amanita muscaria]
MGNDVDTQARASDFDNDKGTALYRPDVDVSQVDEKKLMRKVDWHVVPWLSVLYLFAFLDRGSIGNARLYNMEPDLNITDQQYLIGLTVFFFPYAILEPVSNVVLRRFRPSIWLPGMMLLWGITMTLHGIMRDYSDYLALRFFLGFFEAGLYPGVIFYISSWYRRTELGFRVGMFFSSATIAGAFSGLLAAAIANMHELTGAAYASIPAWAWIFIIEGLATIIIAVASFFIVQDFPESAKFLTEAERVFTVRRLRQDMQFSAGGGEKLKLRYIWQSLSDWKTWIAMVIYAGFDGPLYAFSLFTPTIINQPCLSADYTDILLSGYQATVANLLSIPVYVWGCLVTCFVGFLGDRLLNSRSWINFALFGTGLVGYIILIVSRSPGLSYFAVYLGVSAWIATNTEGAYKRSVTLGLAVGFGNINGAVATNIYRAQDKPWYRLGHSIVLGYIAIGFIASAILLVMLRRENARRERGERDEVIEGIENKRADERNGFYCSVEEAQEEKGDNWSGFRYTL